MSREPQITTRVALDSPREDKDAVIGGRVGRMFTNKALHLTAIPLRSIAASEL
jgi:hypothetical protein